MPAVVIAALAAAAIIIFALGLYCLRPKTFDELPSFGSPLPIDKICLELRELAYKSKATKKKGAGLCCQSANARLKNAYRIITKKAAAGTELFEFERWLFDNYYILCDCVELVQSAKLFFVPHIDDKPRIYYLAKLVISKTNGAFDQEGLNQFLNAFQSECVLDFCEIEALQVAFVFALLEFVAAIADKCVALNKNIDRSQKIRLKSKLLGELIKSNSFCFGLKKRRDIAQSEMLLRPYFAQGLSLDERIEAFNLQLSRYNQIASTVINTLINRTQIFTKNCILKNAKINDIFQEEAAGIYAKMSYETKLYYIRKAAQFAARENINQCVWCHKAINKAQKEGVHIGQYLIRQKSSPILHRFYVFFCFIFPLVFICALSLIFDSLAIELLFIFLGYLLVFFATKKIIDKIILAFVPRAFLPAMDFEKGIPNDCRTLITVSQLVCSKEELAEAIKNLEVLRAANNQNNLGFALLVDLKPSKNELSAEDKAIIEYAKELSAELDNSFSVFIRQKTFDSSEKQFRGWEKKRGAILELCEYLLGGNVSYYLKRHDNCQKYKYILTLDSDTFLNCAAQMVALISHPLNSRYAIISPKINSFIRQNQTAFERLYSGASGYGSYGDVDFGNSVFLTGNYTGKGIIDIQAFFGKLNGRFRQNTILSHDYIEGAFCGAANCQLEGLDCFPTSFKIFILRQLRWIRGDWQLLPFLFARLKNESAGVYKNPLTVYQRFLIVQNMLASIAPVFCVALTVFSLFCGKLFFVPLIVGFSSSLLHIFLDFILGLNAFAYKQRAVKIVSGRLKTLVCELGRIAVLPFVAIVNLVAIIKTLFRLTISKRNLLQWQTFAHLSKPKGADFLFYFWAFLPQTVGFGLLSIGAYFVNPPVVFVFLAYSALSAAAILGCYFSSRCSKIAKKNEALSFVLADNAQKIWSYFEDTINQKYNYLPCDNFQKQYDLGFAPRTSPTNIGFAFCSAFAAYKLKILHEAEFFRLIGKMTATVERLAKYKGNLFNWYDTISAKPLNPKYVSSVDSGNFLASILLVSEGIKSCGGAKGYDAAKRLQKIIKNTDLSALFDNERKQFFIGYNASAGEMSSAHYDLLASEALLTYITAYGLGQIDKDALKGLSRIHNKQNVLYSWTGGAFEYLMPMLFVDFAKNTMLAKSAANSVNAQISFAKKERLAAFGVSESLYNFADAQNVYQYKANGLNSLALKCFKKQCIISPYSTFLALEFNPKAAAKSLNALGCYCGKYGYFEAVDFSQDEPFAIKAFMAHHLGMSMLAAANYVLDKPIRNYFCENAGIKAAINALNEPPSTKRGRPKSCKLDIVQGHKPAQFKLVVNKSHKIPKINLLSNGRYSVVTTESGGGYSRYDDCLLTVFNNKYADSGFELFVNNQAQRPNGAIFEGACTKYFYKNGTVTMESKVFVPPEINGEIRQLTIKNTASKSINIEIRSAVAPCLCAQSEMISHPAFCKMFVKTEFLHKQNCLLAYRVNKQSPVYLIHSLLGEQKFGYKTSRFDLYGMPFSEKEASDGRQLDCVLSIDKKITLKKGQSKTLNFLVAATKDTMQIEKIVSLCNSYNYAEGAQKAALAFYQSQNKLSNTSAHFVRELLSQMLFNRQLDAQIDHMLVQKVSEIGINLNNPLLCLDIANLSIDALQQRLELIATLYCYALPFNTVIIYNEPKEYFRPQYERLNEVLQGLNIYKKLPYDSFIFLVNAAENENALIDAIKKLSVFDLSGELTAKQSKPQSQKPTKKSDKSATIEIEKPVLLCGIGGLNEQNEFVVDLSEQDTPLPFCNIIASDSFGTIVSQSGGGFSYAKNSRENKLTEWTNDAVLDTPSEFVAIEENGVLWSPTKKPFLCDNAKYFVKYGLGFCQFVCGYNSAAIKHTQFIDLINDTKYFKLELKNTAKQKRAFNISLALDIVLGDFGVFNKRYCTAELVGQTIKIHNTRSGATVFVASSEKIDSIGEPNYIPMEYTSYVFANIATEFSKTKTIYFAVGMSTNEFSLARAQKAEQYSKQYFAALNPLKIQTPDKRLDALFNTWLGYQVVCSRFNARAGFYQAGGAIGFRDQLQDCLAVMYFDSKAVRAHILDCSEHQFLEGDVQHWWHPPRLGVRTRISDDKLFLPLVTAEYIDFTGDESILNEKTPYLTGVELPKNKAIFCEAKQSTTYETLKNHCIRAIDSAMELGKNGLCLMGTGDWNDAMDEVGAQRKGESVFLTMLLYYTIKRFFKYSGERQEAYREALQVLKNNINKNAFENGQFLRAFYDDGSKLGFGLDDQCKIDLLTQSWAALSEAGDKGKTDAALEKAGQLLVDKKNRLIKLLTPPFDTSSKKTGYIQYYPKGVRENGGQYSHGAIWYIMALYKTGKFDQAYDLLKMINPLDICADIEGAKKYKAEPYVLAGDVYSAEGMEGRAGWSWYTGSASWYYKCVAEELFGLKFRGERLYIKPQLPSHWHQCKVFVSYHDINIEIEIKKDYSQSGIFVDGIKYNTDYILLKSSLNNKKVLVFVD